MNTRERETVSARWYGRYGIGTDGDVAAYARTSSFCASVSSEISVNKLSRFRFESAINKFQRSRLRHFGEIVALIIAQELNAR